MAATGADNGADDDDAGAPAEGQLDAEDDDVELST